MKTYESLNIEKRAAQVIEDFLNHLPNLLIKHIDRVGETRTRENGVDLIIEGRFAGKPLHLVVEVKSNGQPRVVREAAYQLHRHLRDTQTQGVPIVMAPYLSPQAREACKEERVGYLDFMGNAHIAFDTVYIEREVARRPEPERRLLRSLYKPKSARILRRLLSEPKRSWRTAELAEAAKVSAGLVSTVGARLREHGWAEHTDQGLALVAPNDLLDSWAENYDLPRGEEHRCYTTLHGSALFDSLRGLAIEKGRTALASFSAAEWLAPFVRHPNTYFYADEAGLAALIRILGLKDAPKGANVIIVIPEEDGVLDDARQVADGLVATSPIQTYLDLMHAGDRGQEGAAQLRSQLLDWHP
jgi:hypothetical protein